MRFKMDFSDLENTDITEKDIKEALSRPSYFGYHGNLPLFETWSLGPVIRTRDSNLLEESNANELEKLLEKDESLEDEWDIVGANHWAVGWVDHLAFRVVDENGEPTRIFRIVKGWFDFLRKVYRILRA